MTDRQERLESIRVIIHRLQAQISDLSAECKKLEKEQFLEEHPCSCVKLNGDVEIYDMAEQSRRNRNPLQLGAVYDTYSARNDCTECGGSGKPRPKHNHFGENFMPDSCPACKAQQEKSQKEYEERNR